MPIIVERVTLPLQPPYSWDTLKPQLAKITADVFSISANKFDLDVYPSSADLYLIRDSKTKDIVGYNAVFFADYFFNAEKRRAIKIGPTAVLPAYRKDKVTMWTTVQTLARQFVQIYAGFKMSADVFVAAGNDRFSELFKKLPDQHQGIDVDALVKAAAAAIYPSHVDTEEFAQHQKIDSVWTPKNQKTELSATICCVPLTVSNVTAAMWAQYQRVFEKALHRWGFFSGHHHVAKDMVEEARVGQPLRARL